MIRVLPVTLLISLGALCLGRPALPPAELPGLLRGQGDPMLGVLFWHLRLPRLLLALGAGAALGLSGAILQSLLRNPLAAPDVIGVTAGASLGAVTVMVVLGGSGLALVAGAGAGALGLGALVMTLSRRGGRSEPARLVLVGIGLGLTAFAGVDLLLARAGDATNAAALAWMTGSLNGRGGTEAAMVWAALLPLGAVACAARRRLNRLELGDDLAQSLGIAPGPNRTGLALLAMALTAVAVAAVGPVPFVAFIAGPLARSLAGRHGPAPALAGLIGGTLLVGADLAARTAIPGVLLPAGVMTGLIGAPWLLWTLHRQIEKARI